jgi:hypothetical protein
MGLKGADTGQVTVIRADRPIFWDTCNLRELQRIDHWGIPEHLQSHHHVDGPLRNDVCRPFFGNILGQMQFAFLDGEIQNFGIEEMSTNRVNG